MNHTSPSSVPKKEEMESLVVMFFARRLFLEDKTGFQTGPRHGFFDLLPSFFSSWSDPGERFDRTRKKLACFPGARQSGWLISLGAEPGKRFCQPLLSCLLFVQAEFLCKDNSI